MGIPISNTKVTLLAPVQTTEQEDYDPHNRAVVVSGIRAAISPNGGARSTSADEGTIVSASYQCTLDPVASLTSDTVLRDENNGNLYSISAFYEVRFPLHYLYVGLELLDD